MLNYSGNDLQSNYLNYYFDSFYNNFGDCHFNNQAQAQDDSVIQIFFNNSKENSRENNIITKPTSFLASDSDSKINSNDNKKCGERIQIMIEEIEPKKDGNLLGKKCGRKPKNEPKNEKDQFTHSRNKTDNIFDKIKRVIFNYIIEKVNGSLRFTYKRFLNFNTDISKNLKKDYNIELMEKTIKQIFEENTPSNRSDISNEEVKNKNKLIIKEIFDKNEETETIKILNTKFIDLLKQEETKKYIIDKIKNKVEKKGTKTNTENSDDYMEKVRYWVENYENWFYEKRGRKRHEN